MAHRKLRKTKTENDGFILVNGELRYVNVETGDDSYVDMLGSEEFENTLNASGITVIRVQSLSSQWHEHEYVGASTFVNLDIRVELTIRKEIRGGKIYWYAYRRAGGKLYKRYVGTSDNVTEKRLVDVARKLP